MLTEKHQDAYRTIGEVSVDVGVAPHVLRFWEEQFFQINPHKRRGRRYYRQDDVAIIKIIKTLLYDKGFTIKGVRKFLKSKESLEIENTREVQNVFSDSAAKENKQINAADMLQLQQVHFGLRALRDKMLNTSS